MKKELPVVGTLTSCPECGRKILVERGLIGVNHSIEIFVTCWRCLNKKAQDKARNKYQIKDKGDENKKHSVAWFAAAELWGDIVDRIKDIVRDFREPYDPDEGVGGISISPTNSRRMR